MLRGSWGGRDGRGGCELYRESVETNTERGRRLKKKNREGLCVLGRRGGGSM